MVQRYDLIVSGTIDFSYIFAFSISMSLLLSAVSRAFNGIRIYPRGVSVPQFILRTV